MADWIFIFVLHNLSIKDAIGNEFIAIVPKNDSRISNLISEHGALKYITNGFSDHFKRKVEPAVLIVNKKAPKRVLYNDALAAFRNIIAILNIAESWQQFLSGYQQPFIPNYSDYFDFYPISPSKDYKYFLTWSPALHGLDEPKDFRGQTSPEIATSMNAIRFNSELEKKLLVHWEERFVKGKEGEWFNTILFRSLEVAYHASALPLKNGSTIYDYGYCIALWVSAFEILAHPQIESSSYKLVMELLGKVDFNAKKLRNRYYSITLPGKKRIKLRVTLAQKLYFQMHRCRNDFIHGNPVNKRDLLPDKNENKYSLNLYAPLLYKVALKGFLGLFKGTNDLNLLAMSDYADVRRLEKGLLSALNKRRS